MPFGKLLDRGDLELLVETERRENLTEREACPFAALRSEHALNDVRVLRRVQLGPVGRVLLSKGKMEPADARLESPRKRRRCEIGFLDGNAFLITEAKDEVATKIRIAARAILSARATESRRAVVSGCCAPPVVLTSAISIALRKIVRIVLLCRGAPAKGPCAMVVLRSVRGARQEGAMRQAGGARGRVSR